jgi:hypothetical protein
MNHVMILEKEMKDKTFKHLNDLNHKHVKGDVKCACNMSKYLELKDV